MTFKTLNDDEITIMTKDVMVSKTVFLDDDEKFKPQYVVHVKENSKLSFEVSKSTFESIKGIINVLDNFYIKHA